MDIPSVDFRDVNPPDVPTLCAREGGASLDESMLSRLPEELLGEILGGASFRSLTALGCVSTEWRTRMHRHPAIIAVSTMCPPSSLMGLACALWTIRQMPQPYRAPLLRRYACYMVPISDGSLVFAWRDALSHTAREIREQGNAMRPWSGERDLCVAKANALLDVVEGTMQRARLIVECEDAMSKIPIKYRGDCLEALHAHDPTTMRDERIAELIAGIDALNQRLPMTVVALMGAVMLFDENALDVRARLKNRFSISEEDAQACLDPMVMVALSMRFPNLGGDLSAILQRWDPASPHLIGMLHSAFLARAASMTSPLSPRRAGTAQALTGSPYVESSASAWVLALPSDDTRAQDALKAVLPLFWSAYWLSDRRMPIVSFRDTWLTILAMPWRVQPTLLARLVERTDAAWRETTDWWGASKSAERWGESLSRLCIANGLPQLLVRTLALGCALARAKGLAARSVALQHALRVVRSHAPAWSWGELMEALCVLQEDTKRARSEQWPLRNDTRQYMTLFVHDARAMMIAPSTYFVSALLRYARGMWSSLPDVACGDVDRFTVFCLRFGLCAQDCRRLRLALI